LALRFIAGECLLAYLTRWPWLLFSLLDDMRGAASALAFTHTIIGLWHFVYVSSTCFVFIDASTDMLWFG
jgi:hypothetical protein